MQEKVHQTHIVNIDESKHRLFRLRYGRSSTTDISLQLLDSGDAVSMRATRV